MGSKSRTKDSSSKRAPASNEPQDQIAPASKRSKTSDNATLSSSILSDKELSRIPTDVDMSDHEEAKDDSTSLVPEDKEGEDEDEDEDMELQDDNHHRESSEEESEVEDEEDEELRANAPATQNKLAHTSDRVQKVMTNPEIETAFHDEYMTQITQAFGDELNTLRETDSLEGPHLELLIDSLNQTGHIYRTMEKELWVAGDSSK